MAAKDDLHRFDDLFAEFGRIELRRMFGGAGIYAGGKIFAIEIADRLYFKTDDATRPAFVAEGCKPFSYRAQGKLRESNTYYAIPDRLYDEPDEIALWARKALNAVPTPKKKTAMRKKTKAKTKK
jgi:DNA transformation protein and related proteins